MTFTTLFIWLLGLLFIFSCLWLILVILMQEGKSGGMAGMESASQTPGALTDAFGAGGAQKTLFRVTGWSAGIFFFIALTLTVLGNYRERAVTLLDLDDGEETRATAPGVTESEPVTIEEEMLDGVEIVPEDTLAPDSAEQPSEIPPGSEGAFPADPVVPVEPED